MSELTQKIEAFVVHVNRMIREHHEQNFPSLEAPIVVPNYSARWCKLINTKSDGVDFKGVEKRKQTSVYCFVCLEDGHTKTLGNLKAGDIYKAASWNAPAKHARGSVLNETAETASTVYGANYLR